MFQKRIIPILLISNRRGVKSFKFKERMYIGDPLNIIRIFNEKEVDEFIVIDADKSTQKQKPDFQFISELSGECFMPLSYGGGIKSLEDAKKIINLGIEKLSIQSLFFNSRKEFDKIIDYFDSSSVILSIDLFEYNNDIYIYDYNTSKFHNKLDKNFIFYLKQSGAGEILFNFVNYDGMKIGLNKFLLNKILSYEIEIPFIFSGGAKDFNDLSQCFKLGAMALAGSAIFSLHGKLNGVLIDYPSQKDIDRDI